MQLTPEMVAKADLVLTMTQGHVDAIARYIAPSVDSMKHVLTLDPEGDACVASLQSMLSSAKKKSRPPDNDSTVVMSQGQKTRSMQWEFHDDKC